MQKEAEKGVTLLFLQGDMSYTLRHTVMPGLAAAQTRANWLVNQKNSKSPIWVQLMPAPSTCAQDLSTYMQTSDAMALLCLMLAQCYQHIYSSISSSFLHITAASVL